MPAAKPVAASREEFEALKKSLGIESWEMSPNNWDAIQIIYTRGGSEQQAQSYIAAIQLPMPEM